MKTYNTMSANPTLMTIINEKFNELLNNGRIHYNNLGDYGVKEVAKGQYIEDLDDEKFNALSLLRGLISLKNQAKQFAKGGAYNTGDYFVANENGNTELVASTNHGGAVMNTEQLQQAIYNGMSMALINSGSKEITLKVDQNTLGRVVANSPSFTSEINRRNSALHLI